MLGGWIGLGQVPDELPDFWRDAALGWAARARLPSPEQTESGPVPADHGVRFDDDKHVSPARPEPGEYEPEGAVTLAQARTARGAPQVGQLLAQGEVLQGEVGASAEGGPQGSKQAQKQGDHRAIVHNGRLSRPGPP